MKHSTTMPIKALASAEKYAGKGPAWVRRFHVMAKPTGSTCNLFCCELILHSFEVLLKLLGLFH